MLKTILLVLLGLFFVLNGINHFVNRITLEHYAKRRGLIAPTWAVRLAGILLIAGGVALVIPEVRLPGIVALSFFLLVATFTMHRFWLEEDRDHKLLEGMNFAKNLAIMTELLYIAAG
ncbi:MAG: DoxX family protein [Planctomycetota bacterium]|nr:DoxX family protein [Planctomycetota bacterium]